MNRRAHKKSRNGCVECKRRHIKCDETRPKCKNCTIIERECVYRTPPPAAVPAAVPAVASGIGGTEGGAETLQSGPSTPSNTAGCSPFADGSSGTPAQQQQQQQGVSPLAFPDPSVIRSGPQVNMDHMELLLTFKLEPIIPELDEHLREWGSRITLKAGVDAPYLMHEILSVSALYLSRARPDRKQYYTEQAVQLQMEAISLFNCSMTSSFDIDDSNCVPITMFTSLLGRHLCIDALATPAAAGLDAFLDSYLNFARLRQRGAHVIRSARAALESSELRPFLTWGPGLQDLIGEGHACDGLQDLISAATTLDATSAAACRRAAELIQVSFDSWEDRGSVPGQQRMVQMIFTWAFLVPEEFVAMLSGRRAEAVAVLGYHAVILHFARDMWQIGAAGAQLLTAVGEHLGPGWEEWLAWPRSVVFGQT
ncbi:sterol uptake control protein 2 [Colletotrichum asianum]|uniref:Sterol uptake control protein 2 n=1 Tax=Colletotrichum asianum TaxID=702518 RepID=A0A8H3WJW2_9PEZI|nr:sterol uptake control protein 2 [Colletotrichum asianum]